MAFLLRSPAVVLIMLIFTSLVLLTPARSLNCASQKFTNNMLYANCTDLPTLNSSLHWTFVPKNSSLSVAFVAPPANSDGWIAWAINPTKSGMAGSQALIALKNSNGSMTVNTYNISSYSSVVQGKISFEVPESRAEYSGGMMRIFATVKLTETMTEVNHVWQVGGSVMNGMPVKHEFLPANLKSTGKMQLQSAGKTQGNGEAGDRTVASESTNLSNGNKYNVYLMGFLMFILGFQY